jgi:hypothetical protein
MNYITRYRKSNVQVSKIRGFLRYALHEKLPYMGLIQMVCIHNLYIYIYIFPIPFILVDLKTGILLRVW